MLSYQHHYHAGNHADVLKHWVLVECMLHLQKKPKPFDYIDTHAGAGLYRLDSAEAQKVGEYREGIIRAMAGDLAGLEPLIERVSPYLDKKQYPGSPEIVNSMLNQGERSHLFEMHPKTHAELNAHCARKRQTFVRQEDGFAGLNSLLPVPSRRALVLMDPSYELKGDYQKVFRVAQNALQKMSQTMLLIWYPVVDRAVINRFERQFSTSQLKNVHLFEISVAEDQNKGMTGSGMIVINPPWTLEEKFNSLAPELSALLSSDDKARCRHRLLRPE